MSDRVAFRCDGQRVTVAAVTGATLLSALREDLGLTSVKDGCAPQGQCGCCTVLVDGRPRVACVTPLARVADRDVTTLDGVDPEVHDRLVAAFVATGGSQCGFCSPGILVRLAATLAEHPVPERSVVDRALAAHLCRCTGWEPIRRAVEVAAGRSAPAPARSDGRGAERATLEGATPQRVGPEVPRGAAGFADDVAPRDALVAVPAPPGGTAGDAEAGGTSWVVAESLVAARARAGKVQGRRTTVPDAPPLPVPGVPPGGVALATSWVEPAYVEPDASWCAPGGEPASPLANGGAFGGKATSPVPAAARELADQFGRTVRALWSREDCVRLGPKRPPVAATAQLAGGRVRIDGRVVGGGTGFSEPWTGPYRVALDERWEVVSVPGPRVGALRASGLAERAVLVEGALEVAGASRADLVADDRAARTLLDTCVAGRDGALAGARVVLDARTGALGPVQVRVAAGDPLDDAVLESYVTGAVHMALGWVLTEGLAVDPATGEVQDLTIRSFGIVRPARMPPVVVDVLDDAGPPVRASDAVFAAVAAATWNALARHEGSHPGSFPAAGTPTARLLRR